MSPIKGEKTLIELAQEFDLHRNQIKQSRDQLLDAATGVFRGGRQGSALACHRCEDPVRQDWRVDAGERLFIRGARQGGSVAERKKMIDPTFVEKIVVTPANVYDGKAGGEALPDDAGEVFADSAYRGETFRAAVHATGGTPCIVATQTWGRTVQQSLARLDAWSQLIHRVRGRIEKMFGTWKGSYGLQRMRWMGLAKAPLKIRLTAIAHNM